MAKFRIATPAGASFTVAGGGYGYEMEALTPIDAEIYEIPAGSEDEFVAAAKDADALYAKGRPITKQMIDGLAAARSSRSAASGSTASMSRRRPPRASRSPIAPTPSSRKSPTTRCG